MSVALSEPGAPGTRDAEAAAESSTEAASPGDAGQRGELHIADRVVQKIAAQAVTEVDLAGGAPRTLLGARLTKADPDGPARADAHVDGSLVTLSVTLAVQWPAPVREVAEQARQHLTRRVQELTGLTVAEIDVDVPSLLTGRRPAQRVR